MVGIIAEIGINHNGNKDTAINLIVAASKAGANFVKFQTYQADKLEPPGKRRDMLKDLQMPLDWYEELQDVSMSLGVEFMSSPFDVESLEFLVGLGVGFIKLPSGALWDSELLEAAGEIDIPVFMSTGGASLDMIMNAAEIANPACIMQCTSAYPCPTEDVNLLAMAEMGEAVGASWGLSDHTTSVNIPAYAAAMGATIIEKHFSLIGNLRAPDHHMSLVEVEFEQMVENVKELEKAAGDNVKHICKSEYPVREIQETRLAWRLQCSTS